MLGELLRDIFGRRHLGPHTHAWLKERSQVCPICGNTARIIDSLDFGRSCEPNIRLNSDGLSVDYLYCQFCGFCFAPDLWLWSTDQFKQKIYNEDYVKVDPDYLGKRPHLSLQLVEEFFSSAKQKITHLDFGGGDGLLSQLMAKQGWTSRSYDPMIDCETPLSSLGHFDLITAIEVFEHVPDVERLLESLKAVSHENTVILFTTLLSDGHINPKARLDWWYAAPRNGHISLFSSTSLAILLKKYGFSFHSISQGVHCAFKKKPSWAEHIMDFR